MVMKLILQPTNAAPRDADLVTALVTTMEKHQAVIQHHLTKLQDPELYATIQITSLSACGLKP